jgi:hypothetical protein
MLANDGRLRFIDLGSCGKACQPGDNLSSSFFTNTMNGTPGM